MGKKQSLRNKAAHFVSDLTTVLLNPISDNNNKPSKPSPPPSEEEVGESKGSESEGGDDPISDSCHEGEFCCEEKFVSRSKQKLGRAIYQAARMGGFRIQDGKDNFETKFDDGHGVEMKHIQPVKEPVVPLDDHIPEKSEPSMLIR
ncbi:putative oxidation resistance protein 1-like isoform X3 [Sesbania bispinosa]|nr:putative oxidation resistance protein 1-like isoform X3 [Sesbania bispinosa]